MERNHDFVSDLYHDLRADVFNRNDICRVCGGLYPKRYDDENEETRGLCDNCLKAYQVIGIHIWD